ncbi:MAG: hypothetical protein J6A02_02060 [Prevotella sp.]|nr:hypothetical protein [Prevotella sp.]
MRFPNRFNLESSKLQALLLYKLILLVFTLYIGITYEHIFPIYVYILGVICYFLYYIIGINTVRRFSHIADLALIVIFLFGKHLNSFGFALYLLLPIICRGIYTNKNNNDKFFYIEYLLTLLILCIFPEFDGWKGIVHLIIPVLLIMLVNFCYYRRWDIDEMDADLLDLLDNYYISALQSYQVYRGAIKLLKKQGVNISNIACFTADDNYNKLHLVNSSSLIFRFEYNLNTSIKEKLRRFEYAHNGDYTIDGLKFSQNITFAIKQESDKNNFCYLLFVVFFDGEKPNILENRIDGLHRFFSRMSKVILFERELRLRRTDEIQNLQQKSRFVNASINTMHFIKNRMTPFQTLLDYLKNEGNIQELESYPKLLANVRKSCEREMKAILERSAYLLNKDNNPFKFQVLTDVDSRNIFTLLRTIWTDTFIEEFDNLTTTGRECLNVSVNLEGLDVLFSDIIGNIQKYSITKRSCIFDVQDKNLVITFKNDFKNIREVEALVSYMNGDEKDEVQFRITHGTPLIKQNCKDQNIRMSSSIVSDDDAYKLYQLQLIIKTI